MNWSYEEYMKNPEWFNDEVYNILHKEIRSSRQSQFKANIKRSK